MKGFTLIELIIVAVIVGIVAAIAYATWVAPTNKEFRENRQAEEEAKPLLKIPPHRIEPLKVSSIWGDGIYRLRDEQTGIVCYAYMGAGISCVRPPRLQVEAP